MDPELEALHFFQIYLRARWGEAPSMTVEKSPEGFRVDVLETPGILDTDHTLSTPDLGFSFDDAASQIEQAEVCHARALEIRELFAERFSKIEPPVDLSVRVYPVPEAGFSIDVEADLGAGSRVTRLSVDALDFSAKEVYFAFTEDVGQHLTEKNLAHLLSSEFDGRFDFKVAVDELSPEDKAKIGPEANYRITVTSSIEDHIWSYATHAQSLAELESTIPPEIRETLVQLSRGRNLEERIPVRRTHERGGELHAVQGNMDAEPISPEATPHLEIVQDVSELTSDFSTSRMQTHLETELQKTHPEYTFEVRISDRAFEGLHYVDVSAERDGEKASRTFRIHPDRTLLRDAVEQAKPAIEALNLKLGIANDPTLGL